MDLSETDEERDELGELACNSNSTREDDQMVNMFDPDLLEQLMKAKTGDPSRFQSYWEKDEEDIDLATAAEIANNPVQRILWAAEENKHDVASEMLCSDPQLVHVQDQDGYTPLHRASYEGHCSMVEFLLSRGANIHAKTSDGWQPLHSAARWNQAKTAAILIQNGADVNAQSNGGQTPLMLAASNKEGCETLQLLLFNDDVRTDLKNGTNETAYDICARSSGYLYLFEMKEDSINCLRNTFQTSPSGVT